MGALELVKENLGSESTRETQIFAMKKHSLDYLKSLRLTVQTLVMETFFEA